MAKKNTNKTVPTNASVQEFVEKQSKRRIEESQVLMKMMGKITGEKAVLWGESILGFGLQHYKSEAGREGDMPLLAFSPRKSALTLYFYEGFQPYGEELKKLGKHKTSVSCLYINKLEDVDLEVLEKMLKTSYKGTGKKKKLESVEEYLQSIPKESEKAFTELRNLVRTLLPNSQEVLSYGIIGYKIDKRRAKVFISAWKDHLGMYPVPPSLNEEVKPYRRGKGTLWFPLEKELPVELIKRIVLTLAQE